MYKSFVKALSKTSEKEFNKKFTTKDGHDIFHKDNQYWGMCPCCDDYDDHDYYSDDYYNYEYDYIMSRTHMFFDNIYKLEKFFEPEFVKNLKESKKVEFDSLEVFFDINLKDMLDGYNSKYLMNFFDEENKYDLKITANIKYKDYDFLNPHSVSICVKNPFVNKSFYNAPNIYKFNIYYGKHLMLREHSLDFILRRIYRKTVLMTNSSGRIVNITNENEYFPEWCETNEEKLMYYLITESQSSKNTLDNFNIKEIIKSKEEFEVFKMYMD